MATPTSRQVRQVRQAIERQHPEAGVLVLDGRDGVGAPRVIASRPRDGDAGESVMDAVVILNPPPREDPRAKALATPRE